MAYTFCKGTFIATCRYKWGLTKLSVFNEGVEITERRYC